MQMNEYQALARRTQNAALNMKARKEHALFGLAAECGEVLGHFQKVHQGHPLMPDDVILELGDVLWFVAEVCDLLRTDMDTVARRNIEKLTERYPEGFESRRSVERDEHA